VQPATILRMSTRRAAPPLARALSHPTRRRILFILSDRVASPRELAEATGVPLGRLSHHVRSLARSGLIELERTEQRRGAIEHFYRARARPVLEDDEWGALSPSHRRELAESWLLDLWVEALYAADTGAFESPKVHLSRTELTLDDTGQRDVSTALRALDETVLRIQDESARRLAGRPGRRSRLGVVHFEVDGVLDDAASRA
jgi:DNA-binding transcriptional ArsR family regulator